jgi:hypothetical protein
MRFLILVKASKQSEAGVMPTEQELEAMAKFNEELVKAGAMLDGAGLHPSREGVRINFDTGSPRVIEGPFGATKELIAGYWLVQFKSKEECIDWARRIPFREGEVEIRQLFELDEFTPGPAIEHHRRLQAEMKSP